MNIEEKIEKEAEKMLRRYFEYYFKKYPRKLFQVKSKFMPYFIKASRMFCIRNGFNAEKLIDAFMMDGFKFPPQLCFEGVWKTYLSYTPALKDKKSEEVEVVENIVNAAITIKKAGGVNKWLSMMINKKSVVEDKIPFSPLLLSFSDAFIKFCKKECDGLYDLKYMRDYVLSQKSSEKILNKIKMVLGFDYYRIDQDLEEAHFIF